MIRGQPVDRRAGISTQAGLALDIRCNALLLVLCAFQRLANAGFFAVQLVPADTDPLEFSCPCHLCFAQGRQFGGKLGALCGVGGGNTRALFGVCLQQPQRFGGLGKCGLGGMPARHQILGFCLADTVGNRPVAGGLTRLFLQ